jgi:hypothetical protein
MDAYDQAVEYLTENPHMIYSAWNHAMSSFATKGSCLFVACSKEFDERCGCLTMVRSMNAYAATPSLTKEIREDERIPFGARGINRTNLSVFAEWQRRLDKELVRTPPSLDPRLAPTPAATPSREKGE